jgi:hypothetical protein
MPSEYILVALTSSIGCLSRQLKIALSYGFETRSIQRRFDLIDGYALINTDLLISLQLAQAFGGCFERFILFAETKPDQL